MGIDAVFDEVRQERYRQDEIWDQQDHMPCEWLMILGEEVGEANQAALDVHFSNPITPCLYDDYRKELIQVAAVAIAAIESLDRGEWANI